jgi:NAD(P)-dependent dehydrogenase (short-subunit alcohol dehydrogenase family)
MSDLKGSTAIITGGAGALGSAVVQLLRKRGVSCIVPWLFEAERDNFPLADDDGVQLIGPADLASENAVQSLYQGADSLWASIHIAGGFAMSPVEKTSADDLDKMLRINTRTCFLCCREAVKAMRQTGKGGRIVNVSARPALRPEQGGGMVAYTVSKAGVAAITGALAEEVKGDRILVNAVAPSIIDTPANRKAMPDADHDAWPTTEQIAQTIAFFASPENATTSGVVVPVYGRA